MPSNDLSQLPDKIAEWIGESGYGLEMRVAAAAKRAGMRVGQSVYYKDSQADKYRETDVVGYVRPDTANNSAVAAFVIECKAQTGLPWVVRSARTSLRPTAGVEQRAASHYGKEALHKLRGFKPMQNLDIFRIPDVVGYSLVRAKLGAKSENISKGSNEESGEGKKATSSNKDKAFEALMSVTKATQGVLAQLEPLVGEVRAFAFPMVVVTAPLFEATLSEDGRVVVEPKERCLLAWRHQILGPLSFVDIVTESWLKDHASDLREEALAFLEKVVEVFPAQEAKDV